MNQQPFEIERVLNAPVAKVWKALTDKEQMKKWYFDLSDFKAEPGFEFSFEGGSEEQKYIHRCKVIEAEPEKKLSYSWAYKGYEGYSELIFELFAIENGQTKLKLTHAGLESFPAGKDFSVESFTAGWTHIIGKSLPEYLAGEV